MATLALTQVTRPSLSCVWQVFQEPETRRFMPERLDLAKCLNVKRDFVIEPLTGVTLITSHR